MKMNIKFLVSAALALSLSGCSFFETDKVIDPNNASVESVISNASRTQINQLGIGVQSAFRNGVSNISRTAGVIGREVYVLSSTELTWTTELLGTTNGGFSATTLYNGYYTDYAQTARRAEIFRIAANNSLPGALTDAEKKGISGYVSTVKAFAMLHMLNMQYKNGIRISYTDLYSPGDLLKPGPFVSYEAALTELKRLLDEGAADLAAGGAKFGFTMTAGYAGYDTPATFTTFNRAVAARVAMYQQNWAGMLTALGASYMDLSGALTKGPVYTYSTTSGDATNPLFQTLNATGAPVVAQASFVTDAEAGDKRLSKVTKRTTPRVLSGINGEYDVSVFPSNITSISIIRNEELILMYAEAMIQTGKFSDAVTALDKIRTDNGLKTLAIAKPAILNSKEGLIDELLNQRRYSLFYEGGHRWFDMRRYGRLASLPKDQPNFMVYEQVIRPFAEIQWDAKNPQ